VTVRVADALIAAFGLASGGAALWMRHVGWALGWPASWAVALLAVVPAAACVVCAVLAARRLPRGASRSPARTGRTIALAVAALGFGAAAYGVRGAAVSLNPFDTTPVARSTMPPASHPVVLLMEAGGDRMLVVDMQTRGLYRWAPFPGLGAGPPYKHVDGMAWSPSKAQLIVDTSATDAHDVRFSDTFALALDGSLRRVASQTEDDACGGPSCVLLANGAVLACAQIHLTSTDEQLRTCTMRLDAAEAPRVVSWDPPPRERGAAAPSADGAEVYFSDRCPGEDHGDHCLFRAAFDGSARTLLGSMNGNACSIVPSPDGAAVIVVARGASYTDSCSNLWSFRARPGPASPTQIASLVPAADHHSFSYRGISAVAFSPDGARLVVLSDHEEGCAGSEGVSGCQVALYTLRADGREVALVRDMIPEGAALAWVR
jgi:hypothetical protein